MYLLYFILLHLCLPVLLPIRVAIPYIKQKVFMEIKDPKKLSDIEDNAKDIIKLMRHGVKFTPTQPDSIRIEKLMIEELNEKINKDPIKVSF